MKYSSSLTDAEWEIVEPLLLEILAQKQRTRPCVWTQREIINGILYQLKNGLQLGRLTQGPASRLDGLLALQAVTSSRRDRATDADFT